MVIDCGKTQDEICSEIAARIVTRFNSDDNDFVVGMRSSGLLDYWYSSGVLADCVLIIWDSDSGSLDHILGANISKIKKVAQIARYYRRNRLAEVIDACSWRMGGTLEINFAE